MPVVSHPDARPTLEQVVRPLCDRLSARYNQACECCRIFEATGLLAALQADPTATIDGYAITAGQMAAIYTAESELKAAFEANSSALLTLSYALAVNPRITYQTLMGLGD